MTNSPNKTVRIWLGGSFDPVHLGHLAILEHITTVLDNFFNAVKNVGCHTSTQPTANKITVIFSLLPTARNPLKTNPTDNHHRLAMLELALENLKTSFEKGRMQYTPTSSHINFKIDTSEIYQTETVFTFNTFMQFREKYPDDSLVFVLGMDSVLAFDKWYRAFELPTLCHLWVMPRVDENGKNNADNTPILPEQLQPFLTDNLQDLILCNNGRIYIDKHSVMTVSSSQIRAVLQDKAISFTDKKLLLQSFLNPTVLDYISENELYHA